MARTIGSTKKHLPKGLLILHEDEDMLVVEKPAGMLTMDTEKGTSRTVYFYLTDYVRKGNSRSRKRIFIVHRLDRDASGILVFAKNEPAKRALQDQWHDATKKYLAVVEGHLANPTGTFRSYLIENKALKVFSTPDTAKGKLAVTGYSLLRKTPRRSLLEIDLLTGRKHQIRVHLAEAGHPIVGDKKYGTDVHGRTRLALHALSLRFRHPKTGEVVAFETKHPESFRSIIGA